MPFGWAGSVKEADKMPLNTCRVIIRNANQSTTSKGVLCTSDVELHVLMLTCPR